MRKTLGRRAGAVAGAALAGAVTLGTLTLGSATAWAYGPTHPTTSPNSGAPAASDGSAASSPAASTPDGGLAFTGADVALTTALGAGAIGVGGAFVLASRRRRQSTAPA